MPELWIPYGSVETLVTLQAENLGAVVESPIEGGSVDLERVAELVKGSETVYICDSAPGTIELLRGMTQSITETPNLKLMSSAPKRVETGVPALKGRVTTMPPPIPPGEGDEPFYAPELTEHGARLFIGTARPDPLFGIVDTRVEACLNWVARSHAAAARVERSMEPQPFLKTAAYDVIDGIAEKISGARYLSAVSRGGKLRTVLEDAPFDAVKNAFARSELGPAKGMIIGAGGKGYDDTLSSTLRGVWNVVAGVRKAGSILLIAECAEGTGSTALEMLVTGRISGERERKRERYVDGLEEIFYLNKLKDEYDVLLLSGLPETYARSKLGFTTAKGSGEAVGRMLNKVGRSGKLNVVPRAPECLVPSR
jgi:hypothetical protein